MLFKKTLDVQSYCSNTLNALFSSDRELVYERLRQHCADPALDGVDKNLYIDHIRAVVIQLILLAIGRKCGFPVSSDAHVSVITYLKSHDLSNIQSLFEAYNRAYGATLGDGLADIAASFSEQLTESTMRAETKERFYGEFHAILISLLDDFKSVKLTTRL